jgi:hypothetical protein
MDKNDMKTQKKTKRVGLKRTQRYKNVYIILPGHFLSVIFSSQQHNINLIKDDKKKQLYNNSFSFRCCTVFF